MATLMPVRFSVIIPALNEAEHIRRAVESAWQAGASEVIVAHGGSSDETAALASEAGAKVIAAPRGRARQQNAAAAMASNDVLLFLHADNHLGPDVGRQLATTLARPSVLCGALRQRIEAKGLAYRWVETGNAARVRWLGLPYGDQVIFVRREVFQEIGGFPDVPLLEDLILMQRLKRRAWPILLDGPVYVSPRRWQRNGIARQTIRNWGILAAYACGTSPHHLAKLYRSHDAA